MSSRVTAPAVCSSPVPGKRQPDSREPDRHRQLRPHRPAQRVDRCDGDSAPNNLIGGDQPGDGNVIAANRSFGVFLLGTTATGNQVAGNLIGTNPAGAANLGNALDGLVLMPRPATPSAGSWPRTAT